MGSEVGARRWECALVRKIPQRSLALQPAPRLPRGLPLNHSCFHQNHGKSLLRRLSTCFSEDLGEEGPKLAPAAPWGRLTSASGLPPPSASTSVPLSVVSCRLLRLPQIL